MSRAKLKPTAFRCLTLLIASAIILSPFVGAQTAKAQNLEPLNGPASYDEAISQGGSSAGTDSYNETVSQNSGGDAAGSYNETVVQNGGDPNILSGGTQSPSAPTTAKNPNTDDKSKDNSNDTTSCLGHWGIFPKINPEACVANVVYIIMWIVSWVLWLSGKFLDISLHYTLHMSKLLTDVPVVDIGWKIFRDLANILFIFILLWIAVSTILGLNSGKTKELLAHLIVVALLINFSLFITKAVVDASNIISLHFYDLIVAPGQQAKTGSTTQNVLSSISNADILPGSSFAGAFMDGLKIQVLWDPQTANGKDISGGVSGVLSTISGQAINFGKIILIGITAIVFTILAAYVFFVAAILFIIRTVVLMMVMILSPVAFLAFILPATEKYFEQWREALIKQSFFAPIYMALCFVVVKTIQSPAFREGVMSVNSQDTVASIGSIFVGAESTSGFSFIFSFVLLIALMLGSILVAKKMEAYGVDTAVELGKAARGFVARSIVRGTYITPVAALAGRMGLGEASKSFGDSIQKFTGGRFGKGLSNLGENLKTKHGRERIQKGLDINEWDKKLERSKFGASSFGSFVREHTTAGSIIGAKATFGAEKSVHEAYEEDEKLRAQRKEIENREWAEKSMRADGLTDIEIKEILVEVKMPRIKDFIDKKTGEIDHEKLDEAYNKFINNLEERRRKALANIRPTPPPVVPPSPPPTTPPPPPANPPNTPGPSGTGGSGQPNTPQQSGGGSGGWQQTGAGRYKKTY